MNQSTLNACRSLFADAVKINETTNYGVDFDYTFLNQVDVRVYSSKNISSQASEQLLWETIDLTRDEDEKLDVIGRQFAACFNREFVSNEA